MTPRSRSKSREGSVSAGATGKVSLIRLHLLKLRRSAPTPSLLRLRRFVMWQSQRSSSRSAIGAVGRRATAPQRAAGDEPADGEHVGSSTPCASASASVASWASIFDSASSRPSWLRMMPTCSISPGVVDGLVDSSGGGPVPAPRAGGRELPCLRPRPSGRRQAREPTPGLSRLLEARRFAPCPVQEHSPAAQRPEAVTNASTAPRPCGAGRGVTDGLLAGPSLGQARPEDGPKRRSNFSP